MRPSGRAPGELRKVSLEPGYARRRHQHRQRNRQPERSLVPGTLDDD